MISAHSMEKVSRTLFGALLIAIVGLTQIACVGQGRQSKNATPEKPAEAYTSLGLAYLQQGSLELALEKLKKALTFNEDAPDAHHYLAETYQRLGQFDEAERHYRRALALDEKNPLLRNNAGAFLCERGKYPEAEQHMLYAAQHPQYPTPELAYENLGACALRIPDAAKAERYFRSALQRNPKLASALMHMAQISFDQGQFLLARAFLQRYEAINAPSATTLALGYQIEHALGNEAKAHPYLEQLLKNFPESNEAARLARPGIR